MGRTADEAFAPLAHLRPFMPFRDASCGTSCFHLQVQDCLRGLEKAVQVGFLDAKNGSWRFDVDEYEYYEQVSGSHWVWEGGSAVAEIRRLRFNRLKDGRVINQPAALVHRKAKRIAPHLMKPLFKNRQVENGDLNWIVPGKLVAFSGPAARPTDYVGFRAMVPEDYWDYYHRRRVTAVVRLNKKVGGRAMWTAFGLVVEWVFRGQSRRLTAPRALPAHP